MGHQGNILSLLPQGEEMKSKIYQKTEQCESLSLLGSNREGPGSQFPGRKHKETSEHAVFIKFRKEQVKAAAVIPPGFLEVFGVNRIRINGQFFWQGIAKENGRAFHVITGRYQKYRSNLVSQQYVTPVDGILQGIAGYILQNNPLGRRISRLGTVEITFTHRGINADEKQVLRPSFTEQSNTFIHPALAASQHDNGISLDLTLTVGKCFVGEIDEQDRNCNQQNYRNCNEGFKDIHGLVIFLLQPIDQSVINFFSVITWRKKYVQKM